MRHPPILTCAAETTSSAQAILRRLRLISAVKVVLLSESAMIRAPESLVVVRLTWMFAHPGQQLSSSEPSLIEIISICMP